MTGEPDVDHESLLEIMRLSYATSFQQGERSRARATTSMQIATSVAAALGIAGVASGLLTDPGAHPPGVRIAVITAVLAWVAAAALAAYAAAYESDLPDVVDASGTIATPVEFGMEVAGRLRAEHLILRDRTNRALFVILAALALTVMSAVVLFTAVPEEGRRTGELALTEGAATAIDRLCAVDAPVRTARLHPTDLGQERITVVLPSGTCEPDDDVSTSLRRDDIAGIVWADG